MTKTWKCSYDTCKESAYYKDISMQGVMYLCPQHLDTWIFERECMDVTKIKYVKTTKWSRRYKKDGN